MSQQLTLADIRQGEKYEVTGFVDGLSDYTDKLHKLGFVQGTPLERANINISDPLVIQIRGSRIALRKKEAKEVLIRRVTNA